MNIFAIGDLHLSFSVGPDKAMDMFGDAWVNHTEKLKKNWQKVICQDDVVILPGDFSWAMKLEESITDFNWLGELPGKKVFVRGNHDLWWSSIKKMKALFPDITFIQNDSIVINGVAIMGSRAWISPDDSDFSEETDRAIYERERLRFDMSFDTLKDKEYNKLICVSHFPPNGFMDLFEKYKADYVVYGHLHGTNAFVNAIEGKVNGIEYRLCSFDKLQAIPQLICKV